MLKPLKVEQFGQLEGENIYFVRFRVRVSVQPTLVSFHNGFPDGLARTGLYGPCDILI